MFLAGSSLSSDLKDVLADELNVKVVEFIDNASEFIDYKLKPQLKTLGPKYGKLIGDIRSHLESNGAAIVENTLNSGTYTFTAQGQKIELTASDILTEVISKEGFASDSSGGIAVILDTTLTDKLIEEGYVREIISKLQTMRKDAGLEVTDRITVYYSGDEYIEQVFKNCSGTITLAVLASTLISSSDGEAVDINGKPTTLKVEKVSV